MGCPHFKVFWDVRTWLRSPDSVCTLMALCIHTCVNQGLIPIVGAAREPGTSMLIEDVACPVDKLADMITDLNEMFQRCGHGVDGEGRGHGVVVDGMAHGCYAYPDHAISYNLCYNRML